MRIVKKQERIFKYLKLFIKNMKTLTALLYKEEDMYVAECPEVGTASQGKTIEDALENLKEATELYLEEFPLKGERKPMMTTFVVEESART